MPFADIKVEMALTQINNAHFPVLLCLFLVPIKSPVFVGKTLYHLQEYYQLLTWAEKKNFFAFTLFLSFLFFFFLNRNTDSAGICSTTSLHRFRPLGKEIMKLIKFHTSFITPCFLPFVNLSKSSVLYSTHKELYATAQTPKE